MPRKAIPSPAASVESKPTPVAEPEIVLPPKTEVKGSATRHDDGKTTNELVVQKVSVPFTFKRKDKQTTEFKDYLRIFIRPDEAHDEPNERWDEHEPEDEAALKQLCATYGKGSGTTISVRMNADPRGKQEFFLDVRHPKPDEDDDEKLPSVLIHPHALISDSVLDMFYEMGSGDPPNDFMTRGALQDQIAKLKGDVEELDPIKSLLDEFAMPGDLPGHLYGLPERLRSIFQTIKRGQK